MSHFDLLEAVQPSGGWFAVVGIKGPKDIRQKFTETREEADEIAAQFVEQKRNVFFGVAKYAEPGTRVKTNVLALKSFWLDIDCGEDKAEVNEKTGKPKGYIDQASGLAALKDFCKATKLPKPIVVNSGRGLHVYWALAEAVTREQWEPVAKRLAQLCNEHDFYIDPAVFEVARILRIPGTYNFKDDPPQLVSVLLEAPPVSFGPFSKLLNAPEPDLEPKPGPARGLTELGKSLQDNVESVFSRIMIRSAKGNGCQQLLDCYENRATLPELRWWDALSIAKFCQDKDTAIQKLSAGHEDYDPAATAAKIKHIVGPHNCETFERNNPGGCDGCPFKGKIKNPIVLGKQVAESEPSHDIPVFPQPFFRGKHGGIYARTMDDEGEDMLVYHNDLFVRRRVDDKNLGEGVLVELRRKWDTTKHFLIPNELVADRVALRKYLYRNGAVCSGDKQANLLTSYTIAAILELEHQKGLTEMRQQFGWADRDTKFLIGDREITATGTFYNPPSSTTIGLAEKLAPCGTLDKWKEVFALYGRKGMEPNAFAALSAFGSPLLKFTGQSGAVINLIHPRSGTGKSTTLYMCNSVYGDPKGLCTVVEDTTNAKIMRLGIMRHLPYVIDEITNVKATEFSPLIYAMAAGKGKERMKHSANELRPNTTTWQCISLCSSNSSFYEKLTLGKTNPDGEMMRFLEYKIEYSDAIDTATAKHMFDHQLMENYGHAGDIYMAYVVANLDHCKSKLMEIQAKIDAELRLTQRERFWSAVLACNIAGGVFAKQLGLIDWDMRAIYAWATGMIQMIRQDVLPPAIGVSQILGDYLNRNLAQHALVVNGLLDRRSNMESLPIMEPRGELRVRLEPDTKKMFLAIKPFREDCIKSQVNYKDTVDALKANGVLLSVGNVRMSKGMKLSTLPVRALTLDYSNPDFLDVDSVVENAKDAPVEDTPADASGES